MFASTRFLPRVGVFGFFVIVGTNIPTDSTATRHVYGYGGMVPVPPAVDAGGAALCAALVREARGAYVRRGLAS